MVDEWIREIKEKVDPASLGMILVHNGVMRATSKTGESVKSMRVDYDEAGLEASLQKMREREGIVEARAWLNRGVLKVGDDIMYVLVAGRFRTDVLPVMQELLTTIKKEIIHEEEV
jgi:molybdopterin synthase catalytic subunit